jgi:hypothetical protein
MITGQDDGQRDNAVILELKQWDKCGDAGADNLVTTRLGGREKDLAHPSAQVHQYQRSLQDSHTAFYEPPAPIELASCAYLHNYTATDDDVLFADRFRAIREQSPIFTADDVEPLQAFLLQRVREGHGEPVLRRVEQGRYRPSKKLLEHVGEIVAGNPTYVLLDEQLVVFERVMAIPSVPTCLRH